MYINGMTNINDTINMIKDTIDEGNLDSAKDYLEELKDELIGKDLKHQFKMSADVSGDSSFMKNYQEGGAGYNDTQEYEENTEGDIVPVKKKKSKTKVISGYIV